MEKALDLPLNSIIAIPLSAFGVYLSVIVFTRLAGTRSFSKMSSFDFAMTVAVGSLIASTTLSSSVSVWEGILGVASVYLLQIGAALLRRIKPIKNLMDNSPLLLMKGDKILHQNLHKARVTESDLRSKLRESNIKRLADVRAVIMETTGNVSVIHANDYKYDLEDWLLEDVREK
ncbi:MAG: YetF domain-containing protein [Leeuwenhoekiella sp.]